MPNKKISQLPVSGTLSGTEAVPIVQLGTTVKTTVQDIANLAGNGGASLTTFPNNSGLTSDTVGKVLTRTPQGHFVVGDASKKHYINNQMILDMIVDVEAFSDFEPENFHHEHIEYFDLTGISPVDGDQLLHIKVAGEINQKFFWRTSPVYPWDVQIGADAGENAVNIATSINNLFLPEAPTGLIEANNDSSILTITFFKSDYLFQIKHFMRSIDISDSIGRFQTDESSIMDLIMRTYDYGIPIDYLDDKNILDCWATVFDPAITIDGDKEGNIIVGLIVPTNYEELVRNMKKTLDYLLIDCTVSIITTEETDDTIRISSNYSLTYWNDHYYESSVDYVNFEYIKQPFEESGYYKFQNTIIGKIISVSATEIKVDTSLFIKLAIADNARYHNLFPNNYAGRIFYVNENGTLSKITFESVLKSFADGGPPYNKYSGMGLTFFYALENSDANSEIWVQKVDFASLKQFIIAEDNLDEYY